MDYRAKLHEQLGALLASEALAQQIVAHAFTAEIFLSYRKMDIRQAKRFMKAFHDIEGFQAVSVWYDSFLTAGRNFDYEIEQSIVKSDAFVLLVTPNLATNGNYVQTTEYPFAWANQKVIIPIEAVETEAEGFALLYPGAGTAIPLDDAEATRAVFIEKLGAAVCSGHMDGQRAYLLGMAYLKGLGVEKDFDRAVSLLATAAEGGCGWGHEAATALAEIYMGCVQMTINYDEALRWRTRDVSLCEALYGGKDERTMAAYDDLGRVYHSRGEYNTALEWCRKAFGHTRKSLWHKPSDYGDIL